MAAVFQHRIPVLIRLLLAVALAMPAALGFRVMPVSSAVFVDAILAEVDGRTVTASDIGLARGLGLFDFSPSPQPIRAADIQRFVDVLLVEREAESLGVQGTPAEVAEAWRDAADRLGGFDALQGWLERAGIAETWARRMVAMDLRWRRYIDLRFRAFAFVPEDELLQALGPGPHTAEARRRAQEALTAKVTDRELSRWLAEARARARIRRVLADPEETPSPFPMPGDGGAMSLPYLKEDPRWNTNGLRP